MGVRFPKADRDIRLRRAPLKEVICQVRIPPLLRLVEERPTGFQEIVRRRFPLLETERPVTLASDAATQRMQLEASPPIYRFRAADGSITVSLCHDFYALSTVEYSSWPVFSDSLTFVTEAVREVYDVQFATRIGLRFRNEIGYQYARSVDLSGLLAIPNECLTSMLRTGVVGSPGLAMTRIQTGMTSDLATGLAEEEGFTFQYGVREAGDQTVFVLDYDAFVEGMPNLDGLSARCDRYHVLIYDAFRWSLAPGSLSVFEPMEGEV